MNSSQALQSALAPQGPEAASIATLTWVLVAGAIAVLVLVTVLAVLALRSPRPWLARPEAIVAGGIALPAVVLLALLAYASIAVPRPFAEGTAATTIEVIGRQWWWELRYLKDDGSLDFITANEIHLPAGQPVELRLKTGDVLHSFWVPSLAGKLDLVPGRTNKLLIAADNPGTYRGQCAEYCGGPHALMGLLVVAAPLAGYEEWAELQRRPASPSAGRGAELFASLCSSCHTVRGSPATGASGLAARHLGPDLTHVASRKEIAAGALANDDASRARWIAEGQHVKPGNLMPAYPELPREDLAALTQWLAALQ